MKSYKMILVVVLVLSVGLYSCNDDDMQNELSKEDLVALEGLREAYKSAFDVNVELKGAIKQGNFDGIHFHDSVFHHFEGLFEEHHENYSHANTHDDHHHADGMLMGSNAMNNHNQNDGHHDDDHQIMGDLMDDHESITH